MGEESPEPAVNQLPLAQRRDQEQLERPGLQLTPETAGGGKSDGSDEHPHYVGRPKDLAKNHQDQPAPLGEPGGPGILLQPGDGIAVQRAGLVPPEDTSPELRPYELARPARPRRRGHLTLPILFESPGN